MNWILFYFKIVFNPDKYIPAGLPIPTTTSMAYQFKYIMYFTKS